MFFIQPQEKRISSLRHMFMINPVYSFLDNSMLLFTEVMMRGPGLRGCGFMCVC